ncbi:MAG: hypothetical protein KAH32_04880 [Chlamydiia bacterium]|nr:hypothetical protein [Chlamydiia bacterium]
MKNTFSKAFDEFYETHSKDMFKGISKDRASFIFEGGWHAHVNVVLELIQEGSLVSVDK